MSPLDPLFAPVRDGVGAEAATRMAAHWAIVCAHQQRTNLTGIKDTERAVWLHYMDALAALPLWPDGSDLLDVGSGAGFPGLVLAMARPQAAVTLLEPRRLRAAFLQHAIEALQLPHVTVRAGRLETQAPQQFGCVSMRAVFSQDAQLGAVAPWLRPAGVLLVFRQGEGDAGPASPLLRRAGATPYTLLGHDGARRIDCWRRRAR